MLLKVVTSMGRERWTPSVVSLLDRGTVGPRLEAAGVSLLTLGMRRGVPGPAPLWQLRRALHKLQPDLVQGWMYHGNVAANVGRVLGGRRYPVVWNVRHSMYDYRNEKWLTAVLIRLSARLSNRVDRIIYNSRRSAGQHEALGYAPDRTLVIPNGFDLDRFGPSAEARAALRTKLGLEASTVIVGLVARYHPMKGHGDFLRAAAIVSRKRPGVRFVLAGRRVDRDNRELMALARETGLENEFFLGEVSDMAALTPALDIACMSSAWGESFPNVIGEAMACAVPCVATDVGDSAYIVGETGKVVPAGDPEVFAGACLELIDAGDEGRGQLGTAARNRVLREFSLERIALQYDALYTELLEGAR